MVAGAAADEADGDKLAVVVITVNDKAAKMLVQHLSTPKEPHHCLENFEYIPLQADFSSTMHIHNGLALSK